MRRRGAVTVLEDTIELAGVGGRRKRVAAPGEMTEPTRAPNRRSKQRKRVRKRRSLRVLGWMSGLTTGLLIAVMICAVGAIAYETSVTGRGPLSEQRAFKVENGQGARAIAGRLAKAGVVRSEQLFMARYMQMRMASWLNLRRKPVLKAGTYEFKKGASVQDVLDAMERGRGALRFVTFPEGATSYAIVQKLLADERLTGEITNIPPEGSLFPSTYDIQLGMERADVIARMQEKQRDVIAKLWATRPANLPISTPEEAVILASIVQREMGPKDQPRRIASVFYNRLRRRMRLQSDPTILYGIFKGQVRWSKPILRSEIRSKTSHNTYQINGLPPTPIANPGLVALQAVMQPAETPDLYFVADGKGGHLFSQTLAEHEAKARQWRKIERVIRKRQRERAAKEKAEAAEKARVAKVAVQPVVAGSGVLRPTLGGDAPDLSGPSQVTARTVTTVNIAPAPELTGGIPLPVRKPQRTN